MEALPSILTLNAHSTFSLDSAPTVNGRLSATLLANWTHYSRNLNIHIFKVAGHARVEGNENADRLAALALDLSAPLNFTGRFSSFPPTPLLKLSLPSTPS